MLNRIRNFINKNRLYSWMIVFIIFVQAYNILVYPTRPIDNEKHALSQEEFRLQIEKRKEALQDLLQKDVTVAFNIGIISLLIFLVFIAGCVFLAEYAINKRNKRETIPKTQDEVVVSWVVTDVLKMVIIFLFFSSFFSLFSHIINVYSANQTFDRRSGIVVSTTFMDILMSMFVLRFVIIKYKQNLAALGISAKNLLKNITAALYSYIGFLPVLGFAFLLIVFIAKILNYTPPAEPIYELIFEEKRPILLGIISILISLIGPFAEEVFFRGFLYGALKKAVGISKATLLSAFLFSLLHTNLAGFIPIMTLGVFLAYLREKTGSLIPPITVHILHNTAVASLMFFIRHLTC